MASYDPFDDSPKVKTNSLRSERERRRSPDSSDDERRKNWKRPRAGSHFDEGPNEAERDPRTESAPSKPSGLARKPPPGKDVCELIGQVRPLSNPRCYRLCTHFLKNDCLWGKECRFSHDPEELRVGAPMTEEMNFSNLEEKQVFKSLQVPQQQLQYFMTDTTRRLLTEATGISNVDWEPESFKVIISGTAAQVENAEQLLRRAFTHCNWGVNEPKVQRLLQTKSFSNVKLRLSPMVPTLKQVAYTLSAQNPTVTVGSDPSCDIRIGAALISRSHAHFEFMPSKGTLYIVDTSTNGTFLNGVRLPARASGKVAVFHGDEFLFPEPDKVGGQGEFGYMVNLEFS